MANKAFFKDGGIAATPCGSPFLTSACPCVKTGGVEVEVDDDGTVTNVTGGVEVEADDRGDSVTDVTGGVELEADDSGDTVTEVTGGVELEIDFTDFAELP